MQESGIDQSGKVGKGKGWTLTDQYNMYYIHLSFP